MSCIGFVAEEVGVEPTRRLLDVSTALKAARPTGDDALPSASLMLECCLSNVKPYRDLYDILS